MSDELCVGEKRWRVMAYYYHDTNDDWAEITVESRKTFTGDIGADDRDELVMKAREFLWRFSHRQNHIIVYRDKVKPVPTWVEKQKEVIKV